MHVFRDGELVQGLKVGGGPGLPLPEEARWREVQLRRGIKGVWKVGDGVVLGDFYTYRWREGDTRRRVSRNFIVLIDPEAGAISPEIGAPRGESDALQFFGRAHLPFVGQGEGGVPIDEDAPGLLSLSLMAKRMDAKSAKRAPRRNVPDAQPDSP